MKINVGEYDRVIRVGLGTGLLMVGVLGLAGLFGMGGSLIGVSVVIIVVGAVLAVTGLTKTCPVYSAFGIDTR